MSESRFEAARSWKGTRLDSLARGLYDIADEGYQDKTAAEIIAEMRERLIGDLLPLLEAAEELLNTMETCHICKAALELQDNPVHCEDCSGDCENHDEPECKTIQSSHVNLKRLVSSWQGK